MNDNITINVRDFTDSPGPRYKWQGKCSGEEFYEEILKPAYLNAKEQSVQLVVDLDGLFGYTDSFFEEAFGNLVEEFDPSDVQQRVELRATESRFIKGDIERYIKERGGE